MERRAELAEPVLHNAEQPQHEMPPKCETCYYHGTCSYSKFKDCGPNHWRHYRADAA